MLLVNENHLQPVHIRFLNRIRNRVGILLSALGSNNDLADELVSCGLNGVHSHGLPVVCLFPSQFRERRSTYRQGQGVIFVLRSKALKRLTILINHSQCICIGLGETEDNDVGVLTGSRIFRLYLNSNPVFIRIHLRGQNLLCHLCFLRHYFRQFVRTYRQVHLIEVVSRIERRQWFAVKEDHAEVRVLGQRYYEMQHVLVFRRTIHRGYIQ